MRLHGERVDTERGSGTTSAIRRRRSAWSSATARPSRRAVSSSRPWKRSIVSSMPGPRRGRCSGRRRARARPTPRRRPSARGSGRCACRPMGRRRERASEEHQQPPLHVPVEHEIAVKTSPRRASSPPTGRGARSRSRARERGLVGPLRLVRGCIGEGIADPDLVVEHEVSRDRTVPTPGAAASSRIAAASSSEEVHVGPVLVEHAALDTIADRHRLQEGEDRDAEVGDPVGVVGIAAGVVDEEEDVDVRPAVGARFTSRVRAASGDGARRRRAPSPQRRRPGGLRVLTLRSSASSSSRTSAFTPRNGNSRADARLELGQHGLRIGTGQRPRPGDAPAWASARSASGVSSGQSTGRTSARSCLAAWSRRPRRTPGPVPPSRRRGETEARARPPPCRPRSPRHTSRARPPPALGERRAADRSERLRRAEPLGRSSYEEDTGRG